jgi:hypothetical protein
VGTLTPATGPASGGTAVTIPGSNFTGATKVTFGANEAASFEVISDTSIRAITPPGTGTVAVEVTTPSGASATDGSYTYVAAPTLTDINPTQVPAGETTTGVVLTGTTLATATSVTIGGENAPITGSPTATSVTVTAPNLASGIYDVTVTTTGGTNANGPTLTYVGAPVIQNVSPASGPTTGATRVTLTGENLKINGGAATTVTMSGTGADPVTIVSSSPTQVVITTPARAAGAETITLSTAHNTSATAAFTYVAAPTFSSISPSSGPTAGGQTVVITGTNLSGATAVTIDGDAVSGFTVDSATQITATTPPGTTGAKAVVITTPGGTATGTPAGISTTLGTTGSGSNPTGIKIGRAHV